MTKHDGGRRILEGAKEMLAIAKGEQPAARVHIGGHTYVPEAELASERENTRHWHGEINAIGAMLGMGAPDAGEVPAAVQALLARAERAEAALAAEREKVERLEARISGLARSGLEAATQAEANLARALKAEAALAAEREACAMVADEYDTGGFGEWKNMQTAQTVSSEIAAAIRARTGGHNGNR